MGTVVIPLDPIAGIPATAGGAAHRIATGAGGIRAIAFPAGPAQPSANWQFCAENYGSGDPVIKIQWYADTSSSGTVVWQARILAITPNADTTDIETDTYATANFVQDTHLQTTGQRLHECSITLTNKDSLAAGDWVLLEIARDGDDTFATDDLIGAVLLVGASVSYSDV